MIEVEAIEEMTLPVTEKTVKEYEELKRIEGYEEGWTVLCSKWENKYTMNSVIKDSFRAKAFYMKDSGGLMRRKI